MKHLFIINPAAGKRGSTRALVSKIETLFQAEFPEETHEIVFTGGVGDAERLTREAIDVGGPIRIYACGGDGTLNEVVNGAAGHSRAAITNVPKGTGNDFLKIFGPDWRSGFSDLKALVEGPQAALDLMDCNGKLGLGSICAGVDARIAADVHKYKGLPLVTGIGAYILSLVANVLFKDIARHARVEVAGQVMDEDVSIICVMNGRYYGGGFMPVGDAQPDDGVLDILVVPKVNRLTFFMLVGKYAKGLYRQLPHLIHAYHTKSISFSSPQEMVSVVDGEVMRSSSFHVQLSERKINFFYPGYLCWRPRAAVSTPTAAL